jgi:hypothetical protein
VFIGVFGFSEDQDAQGKLIYVMIT